MRAEIQPGRATPHLSNQFRCLTITFSTKAIITSISSGAEHAIGYSARDLVGLPITQILADHSAFDAPRMMDTAREWGVWEGEIQVLDRSGNSLRAKASLSSLQGRGDVQSGYVLVATIARACLLEADERAALHEAGSVLRNLSHELNNPLAVVVGYMQLIMLDSHCTGKMRTDMEKLSAEMGRVIHVVERLHKYAMSLQEESSGAREAGTLAG